MSEKITFDNYILSCIGNYVLPAAATTLYQEQELSSVIELSQLLDQSFGTPSLDPSDQSTTYTRLNAF